MTVTLPPGPHRTRDCGAAHAGNAMIARDPPVHRMARLRHISNATEPGFGFILAGLFSPYPECP
jgi:hypothetical protein